MGGKSPRSGAERIAVAGGATVSWSADKGPPGGRRSRKVSGSVGHVQPGESLCGLAVDGAEHPPVRDWPNTMTSVNEHPIPAQYNMPVDYHMFFLAEEGVRPLQFHYANNLVAVEPGFAAVQTGIAQGDVRLTVEIHQHAPPVELDEWEDAVEVTLEATKGHMVVAAVMDDAPEFPTLTPFGPGYYRARVHARGRDAAPDGVVFEPVEDYLVQVWPAPAARQVELKQTAKYRAPGRHETR